MDWHLGDLYEKGVPVGDKKATVCVQVYNSLFLLSFTLHVTFTMATKDCLSLSAESCYSYVTRSVALIGCEQQLY